MTHVSQLYSYFNITYVEQFRKVDPAIPASLANAPPSLLPIIPPYPPLSLPFFTSIFPSFLVYESVHWLSECVCVCVCGRVYEVYRSTSGIVPLVSHWLQLTESSTRETPGIHLSLPLHTMIATMHTYQASLCV